MKINTPFNLNKRRRNMKLGEVHERHEVLHATRGLVSYGIGEGGLEQAEKYIAHSIELSGGKDKMENYKILQVRTERVK